MGVARVARFDRAEEKSLLDDWFGGMEFDHPPSGLPALAPEDDDDDEGPLTAAAGPHTSDDDNPDADLHLPGKHDQKSHGNRAAALADTPNPGGEDIEAMTAGGPDPSPRGDGGKPVAADGVTLPHSKVEVDQWDDGTYTVTLPDNGPQARFTDTQADRLVDALNTVRGADPGSGVHQDAAAGDGGPVNVAQGKGEDVVLTVAGTPVTLDDDDAYDLSYQLALWLDRAGFYDRHPARGGPS